MRCTQYVAPDEQAPAVGDVVPVRACGRDWLATVLAVTAWGDGQLVELSLPQEAIDLLAERRPLPENVERVALTLSRSRP